MVLIFRATSCFLQIFEQDAHAFTRRLNGVLAPGPVCYVAKIDAFVVGNSQMGVDCYKYQVNVKASTRWEAYQLLLSMVVSTERMLARSCIPADVWSFDCE